MGELDGKVAIVTGAGRLRSIGHSTAVALAGLGADVVVTGTGRDPNTFPPDEKEAGWRDVESTAERVRATGRRALSLVTDVTDEFQARTMVERTLQEFGRIDILINNAAMPIGDDRAPIVDVELEMFRKVVDVKVTGTFLCTKAVIPELVRQGEGGKIVNIASVAGKSGSANTLAYNAANFAVVGMTQSMAKELGPHGINVNAVCPAGVATSRMDRISEERWQQNASETPIGRNGTPDEVAGFISYLCTEAASWISGQSINLCGGRNTEH